MALDCTLTACPFPGTISLSSHQEGSTTHEDSCHFAWRTQLPQQHHLMSQIVSD